MLNKLSLSAKELRMTDKDISLTPITRLSMTFDHEMEIDKGGFFDEERYKKYLIMLELAEKKRDGIFKTLFVFDALVAVVLSGKNIKIPGTEIATTDLPAVLECLTVASAFACMFAAISFANWLCYAQVVSQFNIRKARQKAIDPDFLSASDHFVELFLKIFRVPLNIWGADFFIPKRAFKVVSALVLTTIHVSLLVIPMAHIGLVLYSLKSTISLHGWNLPVSGYLAMVLLPNLAGILLPVINSIAFKFYILRGSEPSPNTANQIVPATDLTQRN